MFCPACGRENKSQERKYCAACGINLDAVSQALTRRDDDFFTRIDSGFDQFIARYSERVFKNPVSNAEGRTVGKSWRILGRGVLTSFMDFLLFILMWNFIPLRFLILLVSTPVRLLSERGKYQKGPAPEIDRRRVDELPEPFPQEWLSNPVASVTEHTTLALGVTPQQHLNSRGALRNRDGA